MQGINFDQATAYKERGHATPIIYSVSIDGKIKSVTENDNTKNLDY